MQQQENIKTSSIQTKVTPSFMMQNLTCSNQYIAYANINGDKKSVIVIRLKSDGISRESEVIIQDLQDQITDLKYVQIKNEWKLVICGLVGYRIYSEDGKTLIQNNKIIQNASDTKQIGDSKTMFNGICSLKFSDGSETVCVGSTGGQIYFSECQGSQKFQTYIGLVLEQNQKVSCLASSQKDNLLVVSNQEGDIYLFMASGLKDIVYIKKISNKTHKSPINSMCVLERKLITPNLSNILVCGDYLGQIQLYDLNEYYLLNTINSHARIITSIDCNHASGEILSGSEDSYLNVWKVQPKGSEINLSFSLSINDLCIVGANFQDRQTSSSSIFITCYEQEEIHVVQRK